MWGEIATRDFFADTIAIFKQVRISEFNSTRNLSSGFSTQIILDCEDIPEFQNLLLWQKQGGKDVNISIPIKGPSVLKFKTLAKLEEEASEKLVDVNDKLFSDVKAYLAFIRNNENATLYYLSCPTEKCLRKVLEESDGWRCEKCNKSFPEVSFILNLIFIIIYFICYSNSLDL